MVSTPIKFGDASQPLSQERRRMHSQDLGTNLYWFFQSFRPLPGTGRVNLMLLDADMRFRHDLYFGCHTSNKL